MTNNQDLISVTAFFSAILHAVVILGVGFKLPDIAALQNTDHTLDVVLINAPNNEQPDEAETISTNNNLGGGEDHTEATSPMPWKPVAPNEIEVVTKSAKQTTQQTATANLILGDGIKIEKNESTQAKLESPKQNADGEDILTTKSKRQLERERLIAKLSKDWNDYQKRPKRKFLSPSTSQHGAAKYLNDWRKKVEAVGNSNYPAKAKAKGLSGSMIIDVSIHQDGRIERIDIRVPSPHKLLNDAAIRFIRDAAPYDEFPDELKNEYDIIHITRSYHFLTNNRLISNDASSSRATN